MNKILKIYAILFLLGLIGLSTPAKAQQTEPDWGKLAETLDSFVRQLESNLDVNAMQDSLQAMEHHFRKLEMYPPQGNAIIIEGDTLNMNLDQMMPFMLDQMQRGMHLFDGLQLDGMQLDSLNLDQLFQIPQERKKPREKDLGKKV